ncbi:hypothetical protein BGZ99_003442 [Dissophora globulifera]|uniref:PH domain-containing protein n=1 Tax=Dissophora globulifera TaxID=979702 RepID=A0A9P6RKF7_9FUNG|nr:hypothetical protein BGZ99_003442 [Dissophora globulifera]
MSAISRSNSDLYMNLDKCDPKRMLAVTQVMNDNTVLLQKSPIDNDVCFKATLKSTNTTSANGDQPLKSADISVDGKGLVQQQQQQKQQKTFALSTIPNADDISKTAVMTDDVDLAEEAKDCSADEAYITRKLFLLKHGFKQEEFDQCISNDGEPNAIQQLRLIHQPQTENFATLVEQLQTMKAAAVAVRLDDVGLFKVAVAKCERVLDRYQQFDQILASEPGQAKVVWALHEMVRTCHKETLELIKDWSVVYHTLQELIQNILAVTALTTATAGGANGAKSPKSRRSLFSKKAVEPALPQLSAQVLQHQKDVCIHWEAQMRTFYQLSRAYRAFAEKVTQFSLIHEAEAVGRLCSEEAIGATFLRAQVEFQNTKQLSQLHYQIDYTHFNKQLSKENALTTAEERKATPPHPLFSRERIGQINLIRSGRLIEYVSPFVTTAVSSSRKKTTAAATPSAAVPKAYQLIVATDLIYLCEIVDMSAENDKKSGSTGSYNKKNSYKTLHLLHEPVPVADSQISSTPDIVQPPFVQENMVMVCFFNHTSYILQAESCAERDAWVKCARQLRIERPKASDACREQDENEEIQRSTSSASLYTLGGKSKGPRVSLLKRLKTIRRSSNSHTEDTGPTHEIDPDQLTRTDEEEKARRMELGQPSLWEVRRLPLDLGVIPPLEHPIPFRKSHLYDTNVKIVDITTGKAAPGEFGMGIEDRAAYFRDECALFAVLRPARLIPFNDIDRQRDDFFLCCKRLHKGEVMYVEPPYITDFYARSWLHPDMHIEFDSENKSVTIAKMYKIICSTTEIVIEFQKYHNWLMRTARISPDNTFLCMDYRSHALRISKRIERAAATGAQNSASTEDARVLEAGRKYTELGECNIEFRRMSNAPDALSVGFYNPMTKRDMAVGVMVFDKTKVKATASSLGFNAMRMLGPSNGIVRVSPTEMLLTLWQTDARTRPTFVKGQRIFETVKSKSLDTFKITGLREGLDELEDFMRVKSGTDCKARDISETFKLIEMAFQDKVLDPPVEVKMDATKIQGSHSENLFAHRSDGFLETVLEEEEEEEEDQQRQHRKVQKDLEDEVEDLSRSTDTFRLKSRSALLRMERNQRERAAAAAAAVALKIDVHKTLGSQLPPIASSSFENLTSDGTLSSFMIQPSEDQKEIAAPSVADLRQFWAKNITAVAIVRSSSNISLKSAASSMTFNSSLTSRSPSSLSLPISESADIVYELAAEIVDVTQSVVDVQQVDTEELAAHVSAVQSAASQSTIVSQVAEVVEAKRPVVDMLQVDVEKEVAVIAEPTPGLLTRASTVKATVSHSSLVLQVMEESQLEVNANGVVQATRYPLKKTQNADGSVTDDRNDDGEAGVDEEHHMPVKDLKKRWEELTRMGI